MFIPKPRLCFGSRNNLTPVKAAILLAGLWCVSGLPLAGFAEGRLTSQQPDQAQMLHLVERLTLGPRPGDLRYVEKIGVERFIQEQLYPERLSEPASLQAQLAGFTTLQQSPLSLLQTYQPMLRDLRQLQKAAKAMGNDGEQPEQKAQDSPEIQQLKLKLRVPAIEASQARLLRAIESPRQLQEVMTDFWFNHFNIYQQKELDRFLVGAYEEQAIRPYALGRFRDLLGATAHHPAMLVYLDNWLNTAPNSPGAKGQFKGLNENYARELMELHTLGVDNGYTQDDVIALAKILTGWGLPRRGGGALRRPQVGPAGFQARLQSDPSGFYFDASRHDNGNKTFLGQQIHGTGQEEGELALDMLARHPATAKHLAFELAQYFVSDNPPPELVNRLAQTYLGTNGDIRKVLNALFHSLEFRDPKFYGAKYKTPYHYLIASVRATELPVQNVFPISATLQQLGMPLYDCLTPDGYKNTAEAWMGPDALAKRLNFATLLAQTGLRLDQPPPDVQNGEKPKAKLKQIMRQAGPGSRVDPQVLEETYQHQFSEKTLQAVQESQPALKSALLLGSPERMHY